MKKARSYSLGKLLICEAAVPGEGLVLTVMCERVDEPRYL